VVLTMLSCHWCSSSSSNWRRSRGPGVAGRGTPGGTGHAAQCPRRTAGALTDADARAAGVVCGEAETTDVIDASVGLPGDIVEM
jgi:hypothetical protein